MTTDLYLHATGIYENDQHGWFKVTEEQLQQIWTRLEWKNLALVLNKVRSMRSSATPVVRVNIWGNKCEYFTILDVEIPPAHRDDHAFMRMLDHVLP